MTNTIAENEYQDWGQELTKKLSDERKLNSTKNARIAELEEESAILKKNVRRISRDENRVRNELLRTIKENETLREQIGQALAFIAAVELGLETEGDSDDTN
ncbi:hypothetical protein LCGC14_1574090 [marine sediment metagenome]|uniref:Uncharacterized protein n=1 Tax=marine sediment metagenome TaxID=412755 RepID=A0A0F9J561_9ZZZZ